MYIYNDMYMYVYMMICICIYNDMYMYIYIYIYIYLYPPPCLWHQVRVHRVLSAPAGSGPAGLGGNPASRLLLPQILHDPAHTCMPFFFNDFSLRFWSRFLSLPGGSLDSFWESFWLHFLLKIPTHFWIVFLSVF